MTKKDEKIAYGRACAVRGSLVSAILVLVTFWSYSANNIQGTELTGLLAVFMGILSGAGFKWPEKAADVFASLGKNSDATDSKPGDRSVNAKDINVDGDLHIHQGDNDSSRSSSRKK